MEKEQEFDFKSTTQVCALTNLQNAQDQRNSFVL